MEKVQRRHAAYYKALAVEAGQYLLGADQVIWLDRLDRDHDNLHAALRWSIELSDPELGMRMAASLHYFWYFRGHYSEGRTLRAALLALPATPDSAAVRAEVLYGSGMLALQQGDYERARSLVEESVAFARQKSAQKQLVPTLATLGFVTRVQGDYATARRALEEALTLGREAGRDEYHTAMALHHLGLLALECDRDSEAAWSLNERSLTIARNIGDRRLAGNVLIALARVAQTRGEATLARTSLTEALTSHHAVGDLGQQAYMMYTLAALDADAGRVEDAVRLSAAAARVEERLGIGVWPVIRRERDAWLEPARRAMAAERFDRAWENGQAMTREQAFEYALEDSRKR